MTSPDHPSPSDLAVNLTGERRAGIVDALAAAIREQPVDALASGETTAMPFVAIVAHALGIPMVYLRAASKQHGRRRLLEGTIAPGAGVVVVYAAEPDAELAAAHREALAEAGAGEIRVVTVEGEGRRAKGEGRKGNGGREETLTPAPRALTPALSLTRERVPGGDQSSQNSELRTQNLQPSTAFHSSLFPLPSSPARRIAETLLDAGAVTINTAQPYRFVSGILSPIYSDQRILFSQPERWRVIVDALGEEIGEHCEDVAAIAGMVTSGIPSASVLAYRAGLPLCYVEDGRLVGDLPAGARIVIIEDHITTGGSVLKAAEVFRAAGIVPSRCLATFSYDADPAIARFRDQGIALTVLCTLETLLEVGIARGTLSAADAETVREWSRDPDAWTRAREEGREKSEE